MATNYTRGRAKEYRVRNTLLKAGWPIVLRTGGSHGFCDLIAIDPKDKHIRFIQVKNYKLDFTEKRKLGEEMDQYTSNGWTCAGVVWDSEYKE